MNHILFYPFADINDVFIENGMQTVSHSASLIQCSARCDAALDPRALMEYLFPDACHDEQTVEQMMVFDFLLRKICGHFLIVILSHII